MKTYLRLQYNPHSNLTQQRSERGTILPADSIFSLHKLEFMTSGGKASSLLTEFFLALVPLARREWSLYSRLVRPFSAHSCWRPGMTLFLQVSSTLHLVEDNQELHLGGLSVVGTWAGKAQSRGMGWGPNEKAQVALGT